MKLDIEQVQARLSKVSSATTRTLQANVSQFFKYLQSRVSADNPKLKQLESDRIAKWSDWPKEQNWEMPINTDESHSLSYHIYKSIAEKGANYVRQTYLYERHLTDSIYTLNQDFLDHFFQAIQEINFAEPGADVNARKEGPVDSSTVFVVHGRNEKLRKSMFDFLRSIGLSPLEWSKLLLITGKASPFIGEILETAFTQAQAVIVILSPDDEAKLKDVFIADSDEPYEKVLTGQARPNVLFEGGMAMGRHPERTVFVQLGTLRPFSDILGRHTVRMTNDIDKRQDLANRLKAAGCSVNLEGTDWHSSGDFSC
ncbi:MAG: nucleotide-binding protein [Bacteroidetes bacterium]|nr:nucleotide-binding protein [Bacteroidota bacterium]